MRRPAGIDARASKLPLFVRTSLLVRAGLMVQDVADGVAHLAKATEVPAAESLQAFGPKWDQQEPDFAVVGRAKPAGDELQCFGASDELDGAVMTDEQDLCDVSNGGWRRYGKATNGQEQLMERGGQSGLLRGLLAPAREVPQFGPECQQSQVLRVTNRRAVVVHHGSRVPYGQDRVDDEAAPGRRRVTASRIDLSHTGWPWTGESTSMLWRHPNVHGGIGGRGCAGSTRSGRCIEGLGTLGLKDGVVEGILGENARQFLRL